MASPPRIRSGAVNPGEPITIPVCVSRGSPSNWAIPKSVSTARSSQPSPLRVAAMSTLLGFTSRCSTPAACAAARADSSCWPMRPARAVGRRPSAESNWSRDWDGTSSITIHGRASSSTTS